jgi:hypothetical protein
MFATYESIETELFDPLQWRAGDQARWAWSDIRSPAPQNLDRELMIGGCKKRRRHMAYTHTVDYIHGRNKISEENESDSLIPGA